MRMILILLYLAEEDFIEKVLFSYMHNEYHCAKGSLLLII